MEISAVGERLLNEFLDSDEQLSPEKKAVLDIYLAQMTDYVSSIQQNMMISPTGSEHTDHFLLDIARTARLPSDSDESVNMEGTEQDFLRQKRSLPTSISQITLHDDKRFRTLPPLDQANAEFCSDFPCAMTQLVGNFTMALDLWIDSPTVDSGTDTTDNVLDNFDLALITDDEMNKFWDTLPREFGGLM